MTLAKRDSRTMLTKEGLEESAEQLRLLENYVSNVLRKDEDYGVIPGTNNKPTLMKPGAANIAAAFNCHVETTIVQAVLDHKDGFVAYQIRADLVGNSDHAIKSSGVGSCNSYESKYRYRNAKPTCPVCGKETIFKSKFEPGFYCFAKVGGCGSKFGPDDITITRQPTGRVLNEDPLEQANTILKMATKRAEVDAAMRLPGVARFFTQDLEDMQPDTPTQDTISEPMPPKPTNAPRQAPLAPPAPPAGQDGPLASNTAGALFNRCLDEWKLSREQVLAKLEAIAKKPITLAQIPANFGSFQGAYDALVLDWEATNPN